MATHPHLLTEPAQIAGFMTAGKATFTLKNAATGNRFTFKVTAAPRAYGGGPSHFVKVLTGPDNERAYTYLGQLYENRPAYRHGRKSPVSAEAPSARAIEWLCTRLLTGAAIPPQVEVWHEGRCGRCGRKLTDPTSIELGFGPDCRAMMGTH